MQAFEASPIVVFCPIPEEWEAMRAHVTDVTPAGDDLALHAFQGLIGRHRIVCVLAGKGQLQIPARVERVMTRWHPRDVFLVGIAGGFADRGVRRGDIVVAKHIYCFDFGKLDKDGGFLRRSEFDAGPSPWLFDAAMIQAGRSEWRGRVHVLRPDDLPLTSSNVHDGYVASSNTLVDNPEDVWFARVRGTVQELHAVEMEGAGAATAIRHAQDLYPVRFLMVRGISDEPGTVAGAGSQQRGAWKAYAADIATAFVAAVVAEIPPLVTATPQPAPGAVLMQRSAWARATLNPQTLPAIPRVGMMERVRASIERGLKDTPRVIAIVGPAGFGKSTVLGQVYDACAESAARWTGLIRCSDVNVGGDVSTETFASALGEAAIGASRPIDGLASALTAEHGPGIVLIDTLDLVLTAAVAKALHQLLRRLVDARATVVVTCRDVEFAAWCEPIPQRLPTVAALVDRFQIPPFSPQEVEAAARAFVTHEHLPIDPNLFVHRLQSLSAHSRPLNEIVASPLLLGMLCDLFRDGHVPIDLTVTRLYANYWERYVAGSRLPGPNLLQILAKERLCLAVAAAVLRQSNDRIRDAVDAHDVVTAGRDVEAAALDELISDRTVVLSSEGRLAFFHQTFLEYVVARYLLSASDAERARVLQRVTSADRGAALPWWPTIRQWLVLLDDESYGEVVKLLNVADIAALRAVSLAAAARPTHGALRALCRRVEGAGEEHERILCEAAASVTPTLLHEGFDVAFALLRSGASGTSHQAAAVLGELIGRNVSLSIRLPDVVAGIDARAATEPDGNAAAVERTALLARFLGSLGDASSSGLPAAALEALRATYGRVRAGARLHIARIYEHSAVTFVEQAALLHVAVKHEAGPDMIEPLSRILLGLLPRLAEVSPRQTWRTWQDVVSDTDLPRAWDTVQQRAVGRYVAENRTALVWLIEALFAGPPARIESMLVALQEAAKANAAPVIAKCLLERPLAELGPARVRPLGVLVRELAPRLAPAERRVLLAHLAPALVAAPDKLVPHVIGLAGRESLLGVPVEQALLRVERGRRAVLVRELFRNVAVEARAELSSIVEAVLSRVNEPGWAEARVEAYAVQAPTSPSARAALLRVAEGTDEQLAAAAARRFMELAASEIAVTLADLRDLLESRHDRVRLHALEVVRHSVERAAPSAPAMVEHALHALRDETALAIRQLLLRVVGTYAERTQELPDAAVSVVDRAIREALEGDRDVAALTSSVFTLVRTVAQRDRLVVDPRVRDWGLSLLRRANLTRIMNAEVEISTLLTALGRHYPGLLATLVGEDHAWPPLIARALAIAVRRVEGAVSPLLDSMIRNPGWPPALVRLIATWRGA